MKHIRKFNEAKKVDPAKKILKEAKKIQIMELKAKIEKIEKEHDVIAKEFYDWKEISKEVYDKLKKVVKELGGYLTENNFNGDAYSFYISKKPISKAILKELDDLNEELIELEG